jgi:hypothetical protein
VKRALPPAILVPCLVALVGCARSGGDATPDAPPARDGGADAGPNPGPDAGSAGACPEGQFAIAVAADGVLTCAAIEGATAEAVRARCSLYLGHRDSCNGCSTPPAKWVRTGPLGCSPGVGAGNACVTATLDDPGAPVELAALDLVGDVNGDDKLYTTLHCIAAPRAPRPAPCLPGWAISGRSGGTWTCTPISEAAVAYVGGRCAVYLGWQDSCDGCTRPPSKWGRASDAGCANGTGADNTCTTTTLDGEQVHLFGLNTDGDVDGNDKFHLGVACEPPAPGGATSTTACPDGQFVTATGADGSFVCGDPAVAFAAYLADRCTWFLGWRDNCDACTQPPTKWGTIRTGGCANGAGADNTCTAFTLGDVTLPMFGLNTDGDVDGNDTFYVGYRCEP